MNMGVPVVASNSVPYANAVVDYSNAEKMAEELYKIAADREEYRNTCFATVKKARALTETINRDAAELFKNLLKGI
jgi:hypothetical protein